jgi:hypothetical protein|tara:strand:+ start:68 stop:373 length:306 start_codon:yes stop_codon:yes gene_type:complete
MKTRLSPNVAYEALENTPAFGDRRIPTSNEDYGDDETIGLCLKRKFKNLFEGDPNDKFAIFLGQKDNKFIVGVNQLGSKFNFSACETFDSREEMIEEWILD